MPWVPLGPHHRVRTPTGVVRLRKGWFGWSVELQERVEVYNYYWVDPEERAELAPPDQVFYEWRKARADDFGSGVVTIKDLLTPGLLGR